MKRIAVLSGAGISVESGLSTFRDNGGLWHGYNIDEVASLQGWITDKSKVLDFYNMRRREALAVKPNLAHFILAELETYANVSIITQNVDTLHEMAGSSNVLHLHGRIDRARSEFDENYRTEIGTKDIQIGDVCPRGYQLRPDIVWFGEEVPNMIPAIDIAQNTDLFMVVGTSLSVYPAANLIQYVPSNSPIFIIDPSDPTSNLRFKHIKETATVGVGMVFDELQNNGFLH